VGVASAWSAVWSARCMRCKWERAKWERAKWERAKWEWPQLGRPSGRHAACGLSGRRLSGRGLSGRGLTGSGSSGSGLSLVGRLGGTLHAQPSGSTNGRGGIVAKGSTGLPMGPTTRGRRAELCASARGRPAKGAGKGATDYSSTLAHARTHSDSIRCRDWTAWHERLETIALLGCSSTKTTARQRYRTTATLQDSMQHAATCGTVLQHRRMRRNPLYHMVPRLLQRTTIKHASQGAQLPSE
jgi:hypothetical protein